MNLRTPPIAIAWEIWARSRAGLLTVVSMLIVGAILVPVLRGSIEWESFAPPIAYTLTGLALLGTLACFHFTEGSKKGGFGSFPTRLFNLPMNTRSLVAWPMLYGSGAMVLVYLLSARLLLSKITPEPPLLWPCLYLILGLTQFQLILWSLPHSRYLKLLCLSIAASILTFGWMFFTPHVMTGALGEWGYQGSPETFMRRLLVVLALAGPAAYAITLHRLRQQRHGLSRHSNLLAAWWDRSIGKLCLRRRPFRSANHAIVWQEWHRTGWILPIAVGVILLMTCLPTWLKGELSGQATAGVLRWLYLAPVLLATVLGRGFAKPDFWNSSLSLAPCNAILPVTSGQWVAAKLKTALWSAALTWVLVVYSTVLWGASVADFGALRDWLRWVCFFYSPTERVLLLTLALPVATIISWRFLVVGMGLGLAGRKFWYPGVNGLVGLFWVTILGLLIWHDGDHQHAPYLHQLWPWISSLPFVLAAAMAAKMTMAIIAWNRVLQFRMMPTRGVLIYLGAWLIAAIILLVFAFILCRNTGWLRHLLMLWALLMVPLARPAFAMLSLARNRSGS